MEHLLQRYGRLFPKIHRYYYPFLASFHAALAMKSVPKVVSKCTEFKITVIRQSDNKYRSQQIPIPSRSARTACIIQASEYIFLFQIWKLFNDLIVSAICCQVSQYQTYWYSCALYSWFSPQHFRGRYDALSPVH